MDLPTSNDYNNDVPLAEDTNASSDDDALNRSGKINAVCIIPPPSVPDHSPPVNILEVITFPTPSSTIDLNTTIRNVIPDRSNCGKPPSRYSSKSQGKGAKYSIANYMSTHILSKSQEAFMHNVSTNNIP